MVQIDPDETAVVAADLRRIASAVAEPQRHAASSIPASAGGVGSALGELEQLASQLASLTATVAGSAAQQLESRVSSVRAADRFGGLPR